MKHLVIEMFSCYLLWKNYQVIILLTLLTWKQNSLLSKMMQWTTFFYYKIKPLLINMKKIQRILIFFFCFLCFLSMLNWKIFFSMLKKVVKLHEMFFVFLFYIIQKTCILIQIKNQSSQAIKHFKFNIQVCVFLQLQHYYLMTNKPWNQIILRLNITKEKSIVYEFI